MSDAVSFDRVHVFVYVLNIHLYIVNKGYSYGKLVKDQHLLYKRELHRAACNTTTNMRKTNPNCSESEPVKFIHTEGSERQAETL